MAILIVKRDPEKPWSNPDGFSLKEFEVSLKVLEQQRSVLDNTSRMLEGKSVVNQEYLKENPVFFKNDSRKILLRKKKLI